jgi:very-short-patch-repair endonuclease
MSAKPLLREDIQKFARTLRKQPTDAEAALWSGLRGAQLGVKFRRQFPFGPYVLDFASLEAKLVIEVDGGQHGERIAEDQARTAYLAQHGFRTLRYWNNDVLNKKAEVLDDILRHLQPHPNPPLPAGEGTGARS